MAEIMNFYNLLANMLKKCYNSKYRWKEEI